MVLRLIARIVHQLIIVRIAFLASSARVRTERFLPSVEAYEARIAELQNELNIVQESERAEAQEADRLREEVKELGKKLTETVKLLGERSRECGELEAHNEVLQRRIEEFSMELLDRTMKENKDVLERLKQAESEGQ